MSNECDLYTLHARKRIKLAFGLSAAQRDFYETIFRTQSQHKMLVIPPAVDGTLELRGRKRARSKTPTPPSHSQPKRRGPVPKNPSRLKCHICQIKFAKINTLKRHTERIHETKRKYKCPECGSLHKTRDQYRAHMNFHLPDNAVTWYNCPSCKKSFRRKGDCKRHMMGRRVPCNGNLEPEVVKPTTK